MLSQPQPNTSTKYRLQARARYAGVLESRQSLAGRIQLPSLYPLQQQIKRDAARFNVVCIGRRAGKTYLCTHLAEETLLQGYPVGWFVPDYKVAAEVWRELSRALKPVAIKLNATERRIELENGGVLDIWTLENEDAGRGRKYKRVIVDEAAMASRLRDAWQQAIRPTLTDYQGDAWFPSTPKGLNYFYDLFQRGIDPTQTEWKSWQLPSTVNPYLPPGEIEAAREELPQQVFNQEYLAEFLQDEGAVFRNIENCLTTVQAEPHEHRGHLVVAGVDLARKHDFSAISIVCKHCQRELAIDRFNQIGWEFQRGRILAACEKWGVSSLMVEANSIGEPNLEALAKSAPDGLQCYGFDTTPKSKPSLIQALALALERTEYQWTADPVARHEMLAYEVKLTIHGHPQYSAPDGGWDDTVIARALAYRMAQMQFLPAPTIDERVGKRFPDHLKQSNWPDLEPDRTNAASTAYRKMRDLYHEEEQAARTHNKHEYSSVWGEAE